MYICCVQIMEKKQTIGLEGMEFFAYHGFYTEEQKIGTTFIVDVYISTKSNDYNKDNLDNTINYELIYSTVQKEMEQTVKLIEHLAERIILELKRQISLENTIKVQIKKMHPPIVGNINNAIVIIEM